MQPLALAGLLGLLCLAQLATAYVPSDATRYAPGMHVKGVQIADKPKYAIGNFTKQWTATLFLARGKDADFVQHTCNATTWGGACNKPAFTQRDNVRVKVVFHRANLTVPFRTYHNWTVHHVVVRLDIHVNTAADRGWRKKNGLYPKYGKHALITSDPFPANATTGEFVYNMNDKDELPSVVMYPEVCAVCTKPDGSQDYCQCDRWNNGPTAQTYETEAISGITTPMTAAAITLSVVSPVIFIAYYIADNLFYKKTGRALSFYK